MTEQTDMNIAKLTVKLFHQNSETYRIIMTSVGYFVVIIFVL